MASNIDKTAKPVDHPKPVDVLCGRGGMSNHHPGNEWYRRLIRSNRALYKACPKHTKLLVAKAIVQAVESQNGRFLEKDRASNQWFPCSYKRAVDKTSQALREKERDESFNGGSSNTEHSSSFVPALPNIAYAVSSAGGDLGKASHMAEGQKPAAKPTPKMKSPPVAAPPPPPQQRDSSMFRLLKSASLFGDAATASPAAAVAPPAEAPQQPYLANYSSMSSIAPSFNRLTSQVSDWLTSFWPTDNKNGPAPAPPLEARRTSTWSRMMFGGSKRKAAEPPMETYNSEAFESLENPRVKRSKKNLLEDYEETAVEARMRNM